MKVYTIAKSKDYDILVTGISDYKRYKNGVWMAGHGDSEHEVSKGFSIKLEKAYREYINRMSKKGIEL